MEVLRDGRVKTKDLVRQLTDQTDQTKFLSSIVCLNQGGHATTRQFTAAVVQVQQIKSNPTNVQIGKFHQGMGKTLEQGNQGKTTKSFSF